ncbi:hypothetical protein GX408_05135 [bacterium]|nr:hypothetical protein [bacterium]
MKKNFLILLAVFCVNAVQADEAVYWERFQRPDSLVRSGEVLLNGAWHYRINTRDPWHPIQVPHVLRSRGQYSFRRFFTLAPAQRGERYRLLFENLEGVSAVYLNKKLLGTRQHASTPISFEIAKEDLFFNDRNELVVDLDTRVNYKTTIPHWVRSRGLPTLAGGIVRPVKLIYGRGPCIRSMNVQVQPTGLDIRVEIQAPARDTLTAAPVPLKGLIEVFTADTLQPVHAMLKPVTGLTPALQVQIPLVHPAAWTPRNPVLYRVRTTLFEAETAVDRAEVKAGASAVVKGSTMHWKAIEWMEDFSYKELGEQELSRRVREDMQAIFRTGANCVRVLGAAPSEQMLSVCDELGLAVLVEVPLINLPSGHLANSDLRKKTEQLLTDLIEFGRKHPCVVGWGLGNGYDAHDSRAFSFLQDMHRFIRVKDTRLIYAGFRGERPLPAALPVDLAIWEVRPERLAALTDPRHSTSCPVIYRVTIPMPPAELQESYSEQLHAYQVKNTLTACLNAERMQGVLISPLRDYQSDTPHLLWGDRPNTNLFTAGLINNRGQVRSAYRVVTSLYSGTALPELLPGEWHASDPILFQTLGLLLLLIILFFIKQDKRMSHYVRHAFIYPHGFYTDLVENRQLAPFLTGLVGSASFLSLAALLTSFIYHFRSNTYLDEWLTWLLPAAGMKYRAIWLVWHPAALIVLLTAVLEGLALLQAVLIKGVVLWQHRYLRFAQILTFVHWVPASFLFSLPLVIILYQGLERNYLVSFLLLALLVLVIWWIVRMFRGLRVILQTTALKTLLFQAAMLAGLVFVLILYFEPGRSLWAYASYYRSLLAR